MALQRINPSGSSTVNLSALSAIARGMQLRQQREQEDKDRRTAARQQIIQNMMVRERIKEGEKTRRDIARKDAEEAIKTRQFRADEAAKEREFKRELESKADDRYYDRLEQQEELALKKHELDVKKHELDVKSDMAKLAEAERKKKIKDSPANKLDLEQKEAEILKLKDLLEQDYSEEEEEKIRKKIVRLQQLKDMPYEERKKYEKWLESGQGKAFQRFGFPEEEGSSPFPYSTESDTGAQQNIVSPEETDEVAVAEQSVTQELAEHNYDDPAVSAEQDAVSEHERFLEDEAGRGTIPKQRQPSSSLKAIGISIEAGDPEFYGEKQFQKENPAWDKQQELGGKKNQLEKVINRQQRLLDEYTPKLKETEKELKNIRNKPRGEISNLRSRAKFLNKTLIKIEQKKAEAEKEYQDMYPEYLATKYPKDSEAYKIDPAFGEWKRTTREYKQVLDKGVPEYTQRGTMEVVNTVAAYKNLQVARNAGIISEEDFKKEASQLIEYGKEWHEKLKGRALSATAEYVDPEHPTITRFIPAGVSYPRKFARGTVKGGTLQLVDIAEIGEAFGYTREEIASGGYGSDIIEAVGSVAGTLLTFGVTSRGTASILKALGAEVGPRQFTAVHFMLRSLPNNTKQLMRDWGYEGLEEFVIKEGMAGVVGLMLPVDREPFIGNLLKNSIKAGGVGATTSSVEQYLLKGEINPAEVWQSAATLSLYNLFGGIKAARKHGGVTTRRAARRKTERGKARAEEIIRERKVPIDLPTAQSYAAKVLGIEPRQQNETVAEFKRRVVAAVQKADTEGRRGSDIGSASSLLLQTARLSPKEVQEMGAILREVLGKDIPISVGIKVAEEMPTPKSTAPKALKAPEPPTDIGTPPKVEPKEVIPPKPTVEKAKEATPEKPATYLKSDGKTAQRFDRLRAKGATKFTSLDDKEYIYEEGKGYRLKRKGETVTPKAEVAPKPVAEVKEAKKPWEMTKKEFKDYYINVRSKEKGSLGKLSDEDIDQLHKTNIRQSLEQKKPVPAEVLKDYPDLVKEKAKSTAKPVAEGKEAGKKVEKEEAKAKEPWEMTKQEVGTQNVTSSFPQYPFKWTNLKGETKYAKTEEKLQKLRKKDFDYHESIVRKAVAEGKDVPKKVLDEYPDLVKPKPVAEGKEVKQPKAIDYGEGFEKGDYVQFKPNGKEYFITEKTNEQFNLVDTKGRKTSIPLNTPLIKVGEVEVAGEKPAEKAEKEDILEKLTDEQYIEAKFQATKEYEDGLAELDKKYADLKKKHEDLLVDMRKEYHAELVKQGLFNDAEKGTIPKDKLKAIQEPIKKKWKKQIAEAKDNYEKAIREFRESGDYKTYFDKQPINSVSIGTLNRGDMFYNADKSGIEIVISKDSERVVLQDANGKQRTVKLDKKVSILGNANDPILTGFYGGLQYKPPEPKVSQTFLSLEEKDEISQEGAKLIREKGEHLYTPIPNYITQDVVRDIIDNDGYTRTKERVLTDKKLTDTQRIALLRELVVIADTELGKAYKSGDEKIVDTAENEFTDITITYLSNTQSIARALQFLHTRANYVTTERFNRLYKKLADANKPKTIKRLKADKKHLDKAINIAAKDAIDAVTTKPKLRKSEAPTKGKEQFGTEIPVWWRYKQSAAESVLTDLLAVKMSRSRPPLRILVNRILKNIRDVMPEKELAKTVEGTGDKNLDLLADIIKNKEKYKDLIDRVDNELASEITKKNKQLEGAEIEGQERLQSDIELLEKAREALKELDKRNILGSRLTSLVQKGLRDYGVTLSEIAKSAIDKQIFTGTNFTTYLMEKAGMTELDAKEFATDVFHEYAVQLDKTKTQILNNMQKRLQTKDDKVKKTFAQKLEELINLGAVNDAEYFDVVKNLTGLKEYDPKVMAEIKRRVEDIQKTPQIFKKEEKLRELNAYMANQFPISNTDLFVSIAFAHILSGYETQIVNFADTLAYGVIDTVAFSLSHPNPRAIAALWSGWGRGLKQGLADAERVLSRGMSTRMTSLSQLAAQGTMAARPSPLERTFEYPAVFTDAIKKLLGDFEKHLPKAVKQIADAGLLHPLNWYKYVGRWMGASDTLLYSGVSEMRSSILAYYIARREGLHGKALSARITEVLHNTKERLADAKKQAIAEGLEGVELQLRVHELIELSRPEAMVEDAHLFALRSTYNNNDFSTVLGKVAKHLGKLGGDLLPFKGIVPFTKVVANVQDRALDLTPVGFARLFYGEDSKNFYRREGMWRQQMAKVTLGTLGMVSLAYLLMRQRDDEEPWFDVSGSGPRDPQKRYQWQENGNRPYSIKFGKLHIQYKDSPLVFVFSLVANYNDAIKYNKLNEEEALTRLSYSLRQVPNVMLDMSFLRGLKEVMVSVSNQSVNPKKGVAIGAINKAHQFLVPNFIRQVDRIFDPHAYTSDDVTEALAKGFPIARSKYSKPIINILGDPIRDNYTMLERTLPRFFSIEKSDPIWRFIINRKMWISKPREDMEIWDTDIDALRTITPDEYYYFILYRGKYIKKKMQQYIPEWNKRSDKVVRAHLDRIQDEAKKHALIKAGIIKKKKLQDFNYHNF